MLHAVRDSRFSSQDYFPSGQVSARTSEARHDAACFPAQRLHAACEFLPLSEQGSLSLKFLLPLMQIQAFSLHHQQSVLLFLQRIQCALLQFSFSGDILHRYRQLQQQYNPKSHKVKLHLVSNTSPLSFQYFFIRHSETLPLSCHIRHLHCKLQTRSSG